jgi:hypothetical protein
MQYLEESLKRIQSAHSGCPNHSRIDLDVQPPPQFSRFRVSSQETFRNTVVSPGNRELFGDRRNSQHSQTSTSTCVDAPLEEQASQTAEHSEKAQVNSSAPSLGDVEVVHRESRALRVEDLCNWVHLVRLGQLSWMSSEITASSPNSKQYAVLRCAGTSLGTQSMIPAGLVTKIAKAEKEAHLAVSPHDSWGPRTVMAPLKPWGTNDGNANFLEFKLK